MWENYGKMVGPIGTAANTSKIWAFMFYLLLKKIKKINKYIYAQMIELETFLGLIFRVIYWKNWASSALFAGFWAHVKSSSHILLIYQ